MGVDSLWCVIMAGGAGTRFWPASTEAKPKQLLTLVGDRSLLQMAVDRAAAVVPHARIVVVTGESLVDAVAAQLPELPAENVVGEPSRRDTAAAVALATLLVEQRGGTHVAILTADHLIEPVALFRDAVRTAVAAAHEQPRAVVTFGIVPTRPATGFGYVEVASTTAAQPLPALRFVEKPDAATAASYVASGRYLWNSGIFVFAVAAMKDAIGQHLPQHLAALQPVFAAGAAFVDGKAGAALAAAFAGLPRVSIDKGVMEKHDTVLCLPVRFAWSDVGSFPALAEHLPKDAAGNATRGVVYAEDARNNVVWCEDENEEVAIVGVEGVVVVRAGNRTLVVPAARAEEVKKLVESLARRPP